MANDNMVLSVRPERETLVQNCYEALGYRLVSRKPEERSDTVMTFALDRPEACIPEKMSACRSLLDRLEAIDQVVTRYYLKLVCGVGLAGAVCLGLSFAALHAQIHWLFTVLLILGIFGCTITLHLRPLFTGMGMKKYGQEVPSILQELNDLLGLADGGSAA